MDPRQDPERRRAVDKYRQMQEQYQNEMLQKGKQPDPQDMKWALEEIDRLQRRLEKLEKFVNDLNLQIVRYSVTK